MNAKKNAMISMTELYNPLLTDIINMLPHSQHCHWQESFLLSVGNTKCCQSFHSQ